MIIIGNGLIMSKLQYCTSIFGNIYYKDEERCSDSNGMKRLQKSQNDYLRILTGTRLKDHIPIETLLRETNLLSINQLVGKHLLMDTWRIKQNNVEPINQWISFNRVHENLRSSSKNHIESSLSHGKSFPKKAEKIWNNKYLDSDFRFTSDKNTAKRIANKFAKEQLPRIPWKKHNQD